MIAMKEGGCLVNPEEIKFFNTMRNSTRGDLTGDGMSKVIESLIH